MGAPNEAGDTPQCSAGPAGCDPQGGEMVRCEACGDPACDFHGDYGAEDSWSCHRCFPSTTLTVVVRAEATDTDSMEAHVPIHGEPSPELLADLTLSAADTFERVHGRKPSRVLVEVLPWDAAEIDAVRAPEPDDVLLWLGGYDNTDKGDLRSQGVRAEGADVVATGTSVGSDG